MKTQDDSSGFPVRLGLTRDEAAKTLGLAAVSIDRLTKRGLLRPSRATRRPIYPVWEIERFLRDTSIVIEFERAPGVEGRV